jgi:hypothetical protein
MQTRVSKNLRGHPPLGGGAFASGGHSSPAPAFFPSPGIFMTRMSKLPIKLCSIIKEVLIGAAFLFLALSAFGGNWVCTNADFTGTRLQPMELPPPSLP